jgi:hypothetical protein
MESDFVRIDFPAPAMDPVMSNIEHTCGQY